MHTDIPNSGGADGGMDILDDSESHDDLASSVETIRLRRDVESNKNPISSSLKDKSKSNVTVSQMDFTSTTKKPTFSKQAEESDFEVIETNELSSVHKNNKQSATAISDISSSYTEPDYYEDVDGSSSDENVGILNHRENNQSNKVLKYIIISDIHALEVL